jgi:chromosomal replication initiation ATPase DnaA
MSFGTRQLTLSLLHAERFGREDFLESPCNGTALTLIDSWPDWPARFAMLTGVAGCGKSHLAAIWAERTGARLLSARALAQSSVPVALATGALVLEDAEPGTLDEEALFHLLNLASEEHAFVLFTSRTSPANWPSKIPDLASRLRSIPAVEIEPPDDALLRAVLIKLFADRQLAVNENLVGYVATRIERSLAAARAAVAALDAASLRMQRPVTRALAAAVLGLKPLVGDAMIPAPALAMPRENDAGAHRKS